MFETSVVSARAHAATGRRLSLLTMSLIAHTAVVVGAVAVSISTVEFPTTAPAEYRVPVFAAQVRIPPPLGNPNGGARPQPAQPAQPRPQPQPVNQITAPQTIPQDVPTLEAPPTGSAEGTGPAAGTEPGPIGVPWGDPNSIGTDLDAPPATASAPPVQNKIYEVHEVKAPVGLFKPQPPYPAILLPTRKSATVIVRCVIDRNGRVRDAQVIVPSLPPFNQSVLDTIRTWRFTPGSLNGEAVDTYLNLTVNFAVR